MNFFHLTYVEAGSPVRTGAPLALATRRDASTAIYASSRDRPRMAPAAISGLIDVPHFSGLVSTPVPDLVSYIRIPQERRACLKRLCQRAPHRLGNSPPALHYVHPIISS